MTVCPYWRVIRQRVRGGRGASLKSYGSVADCAASSRCGSWSPARQRTVEKEVSRLL